MRSLLVSALLLLVASPALASTTVIGNINTNQHWTVANSPYNLTGDVTVAAQATLTIDPGVTIIAASSDAAGAGADTSRVEFVVLGALVANGTTGDPIVFKGASSGAENWWGILLGVGAKTSSMTHVKLSDALAAVTVTTGNAPTVTDLTISACDSGVVWQSAATADLERLNITNVNNYGVYLQDDGSNGLTATVASSTIQANGASCNGIDVAARVNATVKRNFLVLNGTGIVAESGSALYLANNVIAGNSAAGATLSQSGTNAFTILNNTIDQNFSKSTGIGVSVLNVSNASSFIIRNNIITGQAVGVKVNSGTQPALDSNDVWSNTTNYSGVSAGAKSLSTNPLYTAPIFNVASNASWTSVSISWSCSGTYPNTITCSTITQPSAGAMRLSSVQCGTYEGLILKDRAGTTIQSNFCGTTSSTVSGNLIQVSMTTGSYTNYYSYINQYQYIPLTYDYHLLSSSPVIDMGNDLNAPTEDIDGAMRPYDGDVNGTANTDMGAYEFHTNYSPVAVAGLAQTVLPNTSVSFDGSGSYDPDGSIASYDWDFGDGSAHGTGVAPSHTYSTTGTYTVKLTVTDNVGATGSDTVVITVASNLPPVAKPGMNQLVTAGSTVTLDGSSSYDPDGTIVAYQWDFGDGSAKANTAKTTHVYNTVGTYTVTLTVTDNRNATNSATVLVGVSSGGSGNQSPIAKPGAAQTVTLGTAVMLNGSSSYDPDGTIASYSWDMGDGQTKTGAMVSYTYATAGTYIVTLTVTDNQGATGSAQTSVTVQAPMNQPPTANPGGPYSAMLGQSIAFDASGSMDPDGMITAYAWDFGDGHTSSLVKVSHKYAAAGSYLVKLKVTDDKGATNTATVLANVTQASDQPPVPSIGGPYMANLGQAIVFDGSGSTDPDGTIASFLWNFGDGTTSTMAMAPHTYQAAGSYLVQLTVTDDQGVSATASALAVISAPTNKPPLADPGGPYSALVGHALIFDGSHSSDPDGTIASYEWDFGDGTMATGNQVMHTYMAAGSFLVRLTVTDNEGAADTQAVLATISTPEHRPPVAKAGGNRTAQVGQNLVFDASSSTAPDGQIVGYLWDFGDGQNASASYVTHSYAEAGSYLVKLTVTDDQGATGQDIAIVQVTSGNTGMHNPPVAVAGPDVNANAGEQVVFNAAGSSDPDGNIVAYQWDFGDGATAASRSATHVYMEGGTFTVTLTVIDNFGLQASATLTAHINSLPVADAGGDRTANVGDMINFDGSNSSDKDGKVVSYKWDFGDSSSGIGAKVSHAYSKAGTFKVTLTVTDDKGGHGSTTINVVVSEASSSKPASKGGCSSSGNAGVLAFLVVAAFMRRRQSRA